MKSASKSFNRSCSASLGQLLLIVTFAGNTALESDIHCLKSIKDSLEDPLNYLRGWNFNNNTEGFICNSNFTGVDCWHPNENRVLNIRLSGMGLKGPFPRGLENCSSLTGLDLSSNELYGIIPSNISGIIGRVTFLDLSSNHFSGEIPVDIANCSYLNVLRLDNNHLSGSIPPEIGFLDRIKIFNVSKNSLTGPVPHFISTGFVNGSIPPVESYANNQGLCGYPLEPCKNVAPKDNSYRAFFISGFATGWALFTSLALYLCLFGFPYLAVKVILVLVSGGKKAKVNSASICPGQEGIGDCDKILKLEKFVSRMSFMEMANATTNFSQDNVVGYGTLGKVYKALLPNGWLLAIKRLHETENLDEEFASEIVTLGRLRHQNLVPLIGFCSQGKEKLLVYKYMQNGSLHDWLHSTEKYKAKALEWPLRMKIAVGVAKALSWLHYSCGLNVVHNGLCSKCILLDQNFEPKISKFWEATIMNPNDPTASWSLSTKVECVDNFSSYTKDVYCFGIVLLELITRKEAYELNCNTEIIFGSYSTSPLEIDGVLVDKGFEVIISQFLEIAKNCVKFLPNQRPTMLRVYESLSAIAQGYDINHAANTSDIHQITTT